MAKLYEVQVIVDVEYDVSVEVEADNEDEAFEKALSEVQSSDSYIDNLTPMDLHAQVVDIQLVDDEVE